RSSRSCSSWAKTIHKSQGNTEEHGVVATLDARARAPGLAYVAVSRCRRLADLRLTHLADGCFVAPDGVEHALLTLLLQQARLAPRQGEPWRRIFEPADTDAELAARLRGAPPAADARAAEAAAAAREAESRGATPAFACPHCGDAFFTSAALVSHDRRCAARPRAQRLRAPLGKRPRPQTQPQAAGADAVAAAAEPVPAPQPPRKRRWRASFAGVAWRSDADGGGPAATAWRGHFERQAPGSGTCGLHALNNLVGHPLFSVDDL
ncbi:MAG: hypothetical protein GY772_31655, partial [bacterium]|nr:hypothetical protein [bacterium]